MAAARGFLGLAMALAVCSCEQNSGAEEAAILRAAIDAVLNVVDATAGSSPLPIADFVVFGRFLNMREGLPMYPGQGDAAFTQDPSASLIEAAGMVPTLRVCNQQRECLAGEFENKVLTLTRPVMQGDRAAVFVLEADARYMEEYLVTVERLGSTWLAVNVRLTNWEH